MTEVRDIILCRFEIAADLFGWSDPHRHGFRAGLDEALADVDAILSPSAWHRGFEVGPYCFSDRETELGDDDLVSLGRYEAFRACHAWLSPAAPPFDGVDARNQAMFWWDSAATDIDPDDADIEVVDDFDVTRLLAIMDREEWAAWLAAEHRNHLGDGMPGFADIVLERHHTPKFYVDNGEGLPPDIFDGWHRSAADVVTGEKTSRAVITSRRLEPAATFAPKR
jgi:hypothetical protein